MYVYTQDVPIDAPTYTRITDALGPEPLAGNLLHLCLRRPDGTLFYVDVWTDEEACARAFEERVHPAVDQAFGGSRPASEPVVHRVELLDANGAWVPGTSRA